MIATRFAKSLWSYNPLPTGCVLYIPSFHPSIRNTVFKSVDPYGHTATVTGTTKVNEGFEVDGDDKIIIPNHAALNFGTGDFSLGVWLSVASTVGTQIIIEKGSPGAGGKKYSLFMPANGIVQLDLDDDTNFTQAFSAIDFDAILNEFHFISVSVDSDGDIQFYLDGVPNGAPTANTTLNTIDDTAKEFAISTNSGADQNFLENGAQVGEVFAYKGVALTADNWLHIYNRTKGRY